MAISRRLVRFLAVGAVAVAVLVLDPLFVLASGPRFGAAELKAAVEGTWQLTIKPVGGAEQTLTFRLAQGSAVGQEHAARTLVPSAHACGTRTLVKAAGACGDITRMPLEVQLLAEGAPQRQTEPGVFVVEGTRFAGGDLTVKVGDLRVNAYVTRNGKVTHLASVDAEGRGLPSTLVRSAR